jgi:hypothetical protein
LLVYTLIGTAAITLTTKILNYAIAQLGYKPLIAIFDFWMHKHKREEIEG